MIFTLWFFIQLTTAELVTSTPEKSTEMACEELKPGQGINVSDTVETSPTLTPRSYRLIRDAKNPKKYTIEFNAQFEPQADLIDEQYKNTLYSSKEKAENQNAGGDRVVQTHEQKARYTGFASRCLREVGTLRSPDGTELDLRLTDANSKEKAPPVAVGVSFSLQRANSKMWESDIDCATLTHELLHLTGLVDGYKESDSLGFGWQALVTVLNFSSRWNDEGTEYFWADNDENCRSIEPRDSLMHHQMVRLGGLVNGFGCDADTSPPRKMFVSELPKKCPKGDEPNRVDGTTEEMVDLYIRENPDEKKIIYVKMVPKVKGPAMYNGQMRMITKPNCPKENSLYIACSQNASRASSDRGCLKVPEACKGKSGEFLR